LDDHTLDEIVHIASGGMNNQCHRKQF